MLAPLEGINDITSRIIKAASMSTASSVLDYLKPSTRHASCTSWRKLA
jgi:hypothetical protein